MIGDLEIKRLDNNRLNLYFVCDSSITLTEQEEEWVKMANLKQFDGTYDVIWRSHNELVCPLEVLDDCIACCKDILNHTDDHVSVLRHGRPVFAAKDIDRSDRYEKRLDGRVGNIYYVDENAR